MQSLRCLLEKKQALNELAQENCESLSCQMHKFKVLNSSEVNKGRIAFLFYSEI